MTTIPLHRSQPHRCDYLPPRMAKSLFVGPETVLNTALYSRLVERGFRRSGDLVYCPRCNGCTACVPIRIPVDQFKPSRAQRRAMRQNRDLRVIEKPPRYDREHYDLYLNYLTSRHPGGQMAKASEHDYIRFVVSQWCDTRFYEFRLGNQLVALAVVDHLDNALSAVYTVFDPALPKRSLGVQAVLWQIDYARELHLPKLYLGYWIESCQKMAYKSRFRPFERLVGEQWVVTD